MKDQFGETKTTKFHLGIYAVIEKDQRILLVKKSRGPYGETIIQTLQREVKEETGIELIDVTPHTNQAFIVDYVDAEETISLHHTCLIYKATQFDSSNFRESINEEDVAGCAWIEKTAHRANEYQSLCKLLIPSVFAFVIGCLK